MSVTSSLSTTTAATTTAESAESSVAVAAVAAPATTALIATDKLEDLENTDYLDSAHADGFDEDYADEFDDCEYDIDCAADHDLSADDEFEALAPEEEWSDSLWDELIASVKKYLADERGMSTIEYALGCVAAAALGALLYTVVTSDAVQTALTGIFERALQTNPR